LSSPWDNAYALSVSHNIVSNLKKNKKNGYKKNNNYWAQKVNEHIDGLKHGIKGMDFKWMVLLPQHSENLKINYIFYILFWKNKLWTPSTCLCRQVNRWLKSQKCRIHYCLYFVPTISEFINTLNNLVF